jgi:hypothetical protein
VHSTYNHVAGLSLAHDGRATARRTQNRTKKHIAFEAKPIVTAYYIVAR